MDSAVTLSAATSAQGFLPGPLGLRLDETFMPVTVFHAPAEILDGMVPLGAIKTGTQDDHVAALA